MSKKYNTSTTTNNRHIPLFKPNDIEGRDLPRPVRFNVPSVISQNEKPPEEQEFPELPDLDIPPTPLEEIFDGTKETLTGVGEIVIGATEITVGVSEVASGSVIKGTEEIVDGSKNIVDGIKDTVEGVEEIEKGIEDSHPQEWFLYRKVKKYYKWIRNHIF